MTEQFNSAEKLHLEAFIKRALKLYAFREGSQWAKLFASGKKPNVTVRYQVRLAGTPKPKIHLTRSAPDWAGVVTWTETVIPRPRKTGTSGHAYGADRFVITAGSDLPDAYTTILHEIAHLSAGYNQGPHGDGWKSVFASAVRELTGTLPSGKTHRALHTHAIQIVALWKDQSP